MAGELRAVEFNEGEPLDPNKLNDLKHNIIITYEEAVKNNSDTGYKTLLDSGSVDIVIKAKAATGTSEEISLGTLQSPSIIASIGSALKAGTFATLSIVESTSRPKIRVSITPAPTADLTIKVNYLLVSKQQTS
jgi:hypothetical protein